LTGPEEGAVGRLANFFKRELDDDLVVRGDAWLKESGAQQQLEFEGFQLRWVPSNRLTVNVADGWQHVLVSHYLWWKRRSGVVTDLRTSTSSNV
jgi:hypothetical protein